jgi:integrase
MRFHDLRHTPATLLLGRGVNPKIVSELLSHSHVSVTLGIYSHVQPHMQREAIEAMNEVLGG